jgi:hypothetical protein
MTEKKPHDSDYAPYNVLPAFWKGYEDRKANNHKNPYSSVPWRSRTRTSFYDAQAWDRGAEFASRDLAWTAQQRDETHETRAGEGLAGEEARA